MEPDVVPFKSDHLRHTFLKIVQGELVRAIHYSPILELFDAEHRYIQLKVLCNR